MRILECSAAELDMLDWNAPHVLDSLGREIEQARQSLQAQRHTLMPVAYQQAHAQACDFYRVRYGVRRVVRRVVRWL